MEQVRKVPEDRIKTIQVFEFLRWDISTYPEEAMREIVCKRMGMELARKLFEFQKIREIDSEDGIRRFIASLDVIVPEGKPEMPKIAGDPLTKVTLNLYEADVAWFQKCFGQGYSATIRNVIHNHVRNNEGITREWIEDEQE